MELHTIGIDLGKTVFDWHGSLRRCAFSWPGPAGTGHEVQHLTGFTQMTLYFA
jgi:hypothetical protein